MQFRPRPRRGPAQLPSQRQSLRPRLRRRPLGASRPAVSPHGETAKAMAKPSPTIRCKCSERRAFAAKGVKMHRKARNGTPSYYPIMLLLLEEKRITEACTDPCSLRPTDRTLAPRVRPLSLSLEGEGWVRVTCPAATQFRRPQGAPLSVPRGPGQSPSNRRPRSTRTAPIGVSHGIECGPHPPSAVSPGAQGGRGDDEVVLHFEKGCPAFAVRARGRLGTLQGTAQSGRKVTILVVGFAVGSARDLVRPSSACRLHPPGAQQFARGYPPARTPVPLRL